MWTELGDEASLARYRSEIDRVGVPVYTVQGNHDRPRDPAVFNRLVGPTHPSFDVEGNRFVGLDFDRPEEALSVLERQIATAPAAKIKRVFTFGHYPLLAPDAVCLQPVARFRQRCRPEGRAVSGPRPAWADCGPLRRPPSQSVRRGRFLYRHSVSHRAVRGQQRRLASLLHHRRNAELDGGQSRAVAAGHPRIDTAPRAMGHVVFAGRPEASNTHAGAPAGSGSSRRGWAPAPSCRSSASKATTQSRCRSIARRSKARSTICGSSRSMKRATRSSPCWRLLVKGGASSRDLFLEAELDFVGPVRGPIGL